MLLSDLVHDNGGNKKNHIGDHLSDKGSQNEFSDDLRHKVHEKRSDRHDIQNLRRTKLDNQVSQILEINNKVIFQVMFSMVLQALLTSL